MQSEVNSLIQIIKDMRVENDDDVAKADDESETTMGTSEDINDALITEKEKDYALTSTFLPHYEFVSIDDDYDEKLQPNDGDSDSEWEEEEEEEKVRDGDEGEERDASEYDAESYREQIEAVRRRRRERIYCASVKDKDFWQTLALTENRASRPSAPLTLLKIFSNE